MSTLLVLRTSLNGGQGFSNRLLDDLIAGSLGKWPDTRVVERDLNAQPVPMLNGRTVGAIRGGVADTDERRAALALSDELIAELKAADYIAIGLPRYNFGAPATFKSYIDYVARAGVTFRYTGNGPEGLLPDIPVYVFLTSGGAYADGPDDHMSAWVRQVLGFIGLKTVEIVHAEGLAYAADEAVKRAQERIGQIVSC